MDMTGTRLVHYHIRWSVKLDWERFDTSDEAQVRAKDLVGPGEDYRIEEFDDSCTQCETLHWKTRPAAGS